jgi:hypothetical protein
MKIELNKKGMTRFCQPNELDQMKSAGWKPVEDKSVEERIVLRPPVKSKGTEKQSPDNAIQQGDE